MSAGGWILRSCVETHLPCDANPTCQVFEDPVTTPYGTTYDRAAIVEALRHAKEDPLTRKPLSETRLVPNKDIADAVKRYRQDTGAAVNVT